jgi:FKBP-type peptidyl-prolyl cis-trans isomerase 2
MHTVQFLDTVSISYTAALPSGEIIEQVPENTPLTLVIGSGRVLKAVEASLVGLAPGQTRTVDIFPEDAFGVYHRSLVHEISRSSLPERIDPRPGMILALAVEQNGQTRQVPATVLAADSRTVTVDYNHPLAGKTITYTVKVHAIAQ